MKILIIGDIFGKVGKLIVERNLPNIIKEHNIDLVIANAENISKQGKGISKKDYDDLKSFGVDYITLGNHAFKDDEVNDILHNEDIIRPQNFPDDLSKQGKGKTIIEIDGKKILLFNLLGKELMFSKATSPFAAADEILKRDSYDLAILDFHAETTSEKKALAHYLKDKVKIFFGTHTHIQTSDFEVKEDSKQAYITDVGMTGIVDSAIGVEYDAVISKLKDNQFSIFKEKLSGIAQLSSIVVELDKQLTPISIETLNIREKINT